MSSELWDKGIIVQSAWTGKKLGSAATITDERGYVLLVKHSYGKLNWEIPGGAAERGRLQPHDDDEG